MHLYAWSCCDIATFSTPRLTSSSSINPLWISWRHFYFFSAGFWMYMYLQLQLYQTTSLAQCTVNYGGQSGPSTVCSSHQPTTSSPYPWSDISRRVNLSDTVTCSQAVELIWSWLLSGCTVGSVQVILCQSYIKSTMRATTHGPALPSRLLGELLYFL